VSFKRLQIAWIGKNTSPRKGCLACFKDMADMPDGADRLERKTGTFNQTRVGRRRGRARGTRRKRGGVTKRVSTQRGLYEEGGFLCGG